MVVAVKRPVLRVGVHRHARVTGDRQHQRLARADVRQRVRRGRAVGVVPAARLGPALHVRVLDRERQRQLRVLLPDHLRAQVDLQRPQPEQDRQRIPAAPVHRCTDHRVAVDPCKEFRGELDALRRARVQGALARGIHVLVDP